MVKEYLVNGEIVELTFEEVLEKMNKMIYKLCHKFNGCCDLDFDDLYQESVCYLWKNIDKYNSERGSLSTFTYQVVHSKLHMLNRSWRSKTNIENCTTYFDEPTLTLISGKGKEIDLRPYSRDISTKNPSKIHMEKHSVSHIQQKYNIPDKLVPGLEYLINYKDKHIIVKKYGLNRSTMYRQSKKVEKIVKDHIKNKNQRKELVS